MVGNGMDIEEVGSEYASSRCAGRAAEVHGTCLLVTRLFSWGVGVRGSAQSKYQTLLTTMGLLTADACYLTSSCFFNQAILTIPFWVRLISV